MKILDIKNIIDEENIKASFDNGVLTTLTNTPKDTEFAIYEMGTSEAGEMEVLRNLVKPEVTIILNILEFSDWFKNNTSGITKLSVHS